MTFIDRIRGKNRRKRANQTGRATRHRIFVEKLEDRVTPTVIFHPYFGTEATTFGSGAKLNSPPVELIFWGSTYWNKPTGASASTIASAVSTMMSSPVWQHLSQYGAGGSPYLANWWIDTADGNPASVISDTDVHNEIVNAINDASSPILPPSNFPGVTPLYIVITPQGTSINSTSLPNLGGVKGGDQTVIGYHYDFNASTNYGNFNMVYAWIGNYYLNGLGGTLDNLDSITSPISHETSEAMTDAQPFSGILCNAGSTFPGGGSGEIGDFEPESFNLDEYRVDGVLVQAMWDYGAQAFTVSDGNSQHLDLYANYNYGGGSYTYTGSTLYVYGDQFGSGYNDSITLDTSSEGGVEVTLNGETFAFEPGINITTVWVLPGTGTNTIQVNNVPANSAVYVTGDGVDDVTIGNSYDGVQGIKSLVYVYNDYPTQSSKGYTALTINDGPDTVGRSATMYDDNIGGGVQRGSIVGLAPAAIDWLDNSSGTYTGGVESLSIYGGSGGNTFSVVNDGHLWGGTYINSGSGSNHVYVYATSGVLYLDGGAGFQSVDVGEGSTAGIFGGVDVYNSNSSGHSYLTIDDSSDTTGRTANLYNGELTGLGSPAPIYWSPSSSPTGGVTYVNVDGGSGGNTFYVEGTSSLYYYTHLSTGSGSNDVFVYATTGALFVDGGAGFQLVDVGEGSTAGIHGEVDVYNSSSSGHSYLTIDDSADTTGRTANLYNGELTGLGSSGPIFWTPSSSSTGGVTYVNVDGGSGGDTFNVNGTSSLYYYTYLSTGGGSNTVHVAGTTGALIIDGSGNDTLVGPNAANTWTITGSNSGSVGNVSFSGVKNLTGGTLNDLFKFPNGGSVSGVVNGGGGTDTLGYGTRTTGVTVNLTAGTATATGGISNILNVTGTAANDTITGNSASNVINGNGGTDVLNGGGGGTDLFILGSTQASGTTVTGAGTTDTLQGANVANTWTLTGANAGKVNGIAFTGIANLTGGTGLDEFVLGAGVTVSGKINGGGGGNDWLDYAAYTTPMTVNLATNAATGVDGGVAGGIANIRNVRGGQGGDILTGNSAGNILIGGSGADTITGGTGRSILVGDKGNDVVKGGSGDDIVIGAYTNYDGSGDVNDQALMAILAEWQSGDSYTTRISKIKAGVGPGSVDKFVWGTTVHDDGGTNTLTGGAGMDWFFKGVHDTITDLQSGEQVN